MDMDRHGQPGICPRLRISRAEDISTAKDKLGQTKFLE